MDDRIPSRAACEHVFSEHALALRAAGFAVLPAAGKSPLRSGFNRWSRPPGRAVVAGWCLQCPEADILYITGLSWARPGGPGLVVVDGDDAEACNRIEELFGATPGRVRTRRGKHFLFLDPGGLGKVSSLRQFGINADIKHGSGLVVAPPSRHAEDRTFTYAWDGCDPTVIRHLPIFDVRALHDLTTRSAGRKEQSARPCVSEEHNALPCVGPERNAPRCISTAPAPPPPLDRGIRPELFRHGSRKLGLNDALFGQAFQDHEEALAFARAWNASLRAHGIEPMEDEEVVGVVEAVMKARPQPRYEQRATCTSDADEVRWLCEMDGGEAAFSLLMLFRAEHAGRMARNETFVINITGMVKCRVLGSWSARKYRAARELLLRTGLLILVNPHTNRSAAEYRLAPRSLTPSLDMRASSAGSNGSDA
jgi:hypothetical protein